MSLPEHKKHVACTNIDKVRHNALELLKLQPDGSRSKELSAEIYATITLLHKQVLAMEKRLYLYKETIEGLGFKRVRKR